MDTLTRDKWDSASRRFDWITFADDKRLGPHKARLFSRARGMALLVGVGTGSDLKHYPPNLDAVAIDISPKMLALAGPRTADFRGNLQLREMDVCRLDFPDHSFDSVTTSCTFCSVPKPILGLREIHRVLKPGGRLLMFEHVRSNIAALGFMMDLMTPITSRFGPALNRDTVGNVERAGFRLRRVENVYLDIVKSIEAVKD